VDVTARQVAERYRRTEMSAPADGAAAPVEPVHRVAFGRRDHQVADRERLPVHGAVEMPPPRDAELSGHRSRGSGAGAGGVAVVRGPVREVSAGPAAVSGVVRL